MFITTASMHYSPLPFDPLSTISPLDHASPSSSSADDQSRSRLLRSARIALAASRTNRRRAAQSIRTTSRYFTAFRTRHRHKGAAVLDTIAGMAATLGFPAPAVIYAIFTEEALPEAIPFMCWRKLYPSGGPLVVVCEAAEGEWVEVAMAEDGGEVWATIGVPGRPCRSMYWDGSKSEWWDKGGECVSCARYSPGF